MLQRLISIDLVNYLEWNLRTLRNAEDGASPLT